MSKIKTAHMGLGLDLLGSHMTLRANPRTGATLGLWWAQDPEGRWHNLGLLTTSGKNGRQVGVPWANLKGVELDVPLKASGQPPAGGPPKNTPLTAGNPGVSQIQAPSEVDPIIENAKAKKAKLKETL